MGPCILREGERKGQTGQRRGGATTRLCKTGQECREGTGARFDPRDSSRTNTRKKEGLFRGVGAGCVYSDEFGDEPSPFCCLLAAAGVYSEERERQVRIIQICVSCFPAIMVSRYEGAVVL